MSIASIGLSRNMAQADRRTVEDPGQRRLRSLKGLLQRLWVISPERLWLRSTSLQRQGRWRLAFAIKQLNTILYHNSLSPEARVSCDIALGHYSHGIVVNGSVEIGREVKIWHNVTLTAGRRPRGGAASTGQPSRIVIEQGVKLGANAVVIAPRGQTLRIGRGARIGAGAVVTRDVPARATVVSPPARILLTDAPAGESGREEGGAEVGSRGSEEAALDASTASAPDEDAQARPRGDASSPP
jgi:serine O-acetyltransferase